MEDVTKSKCYIRLKLAVKMSLVVNVVLLVALPCLYVARQFNDTNLPDKIATPFSQSQADTLPDRICLSCSYFGDVIRMEKDMLYDVILKMNGGELCCINDESGMQDIFLEMLKENQYDSRLNSMPVAQDVGATTKSKLINFTVMSQLDTFHLAPKRSQYAGFHISFPHWSTCIMRKVARTESLLCETICISLSELLDYEDDTKMIRRMQWWRERDFSAHLYGDFNDIKNGILSWTPDNSLVFGSIRNLTLLPGRSKVRLATFNGTNGAGMYFIYSLISLTTNTSTNLPLGVHVIHKFNEEVLNNASTKLATRYFGGNNKETPDSYASFLCVIEMLNIGDTIETTFKTATTSSYKSSGVFSNYFGMFKL